MKKIIFILITISCLSFLNCENKGMVQQGLDSQQDPRLPEINVKQGSTNIPSESGVYSISEEQIFNTMAEVIFTIENKGTSDLELTGDPLVEISGTDVSDFAVTVDPDFIIPPGEETFFTVTFDPATVDDKTAVITIPNNDFDEAEYNFTITGSIYAEINVKQEQTYLVSGTGSYNINNIVLNNDSNEIFFTVENKGIGDLLLTGDPAVSISGTTEDIGMFTVVQPSAVNVSPGGETTFSILYHPTSYNQASITVSIQNNDNDENPYTFAIIGDTKPKADFYARLRKGIGSLTVYFIDKSEGEITNWEWDFDNDGITDSTERNPNHKYDLIGNYSVRLKVYDPNGTDTKIISRYIEIFSPIYNSVETYFDSANSIQAIDVDGDVGGSIDIIGASNNSSTSLEDLSWWKNVKGDGLSWTKQIIATGSANYNYMQSFKAGLIDNDGDVDIVTGSGSYLILWDNNGSETFTAHTISNSFTAATSVDIADMDGDGLLDVIAAAYAHNSSKISWWKNDGNLPDDGTPWNETEIYSTTDDNIMPQSIYCADLNGGGATMYWLPIGLPMK